MNYERPELLERLAGAYVLGTMAARARPRFARLLAESPNAQRAVAQWNNELAPLYETVPPMQPPAAVWQAIDAHTRPGAARTSPAPRADASPGWGQRLQSLLTGWMRPALGFALGAMLATVFVSQNAHMFGMHHMAASLPASYVGILDNANGEAVLTAGSHRRGETMTIKLLKPIVIPPGMVARLWAVPMDDGAPMPITNVPAEGRVMIQLKAPAEEVFARVKLLGVTFERDPEARSPNMPFVFSGHCVKFW
ncbi:anti-sigma factor [Duganella callida]|uniref:Anti-sigma K factor RskA C-terminal domain-containing protein n=1 Tax=Duganella callida TaxID=2561932 RepID=A0A4Y9SC50_9BURK|nr:anti-sigma factor [Duganella callida]TFW19889.1 hypothetical protein E4L98_15565 [Duganella callida]